MKFLIGLYLIMVLIVFVNFISEFILDGRYSAIASWIIGMMFFFGTIFFANARYYLSRHEK